MLALALLMTAAAEPPMEDPVPDMEPPPPVWERIAQGDDPYLWLEGVQDERALDQVRAWNARTVERYADDALVNEMEEQALAILSSDARIPGVRFRDDMAWNFWQDADNVRGLWRRQDIDDFLDGEDDWETVLDVDALDATEQENWLWHGAGCADDSDRCMVDLSRGGTDASVLREFDIDSKAFVDGGFTVPQAKSDVSWLDEDTLLVGTDRGEGTLTDSGYPRTLVRWERGTALADAPVVFEGETTDVSVGSFVSHHRGDSWAFLTRAVTFYDSELHLLGEDGDITRLPLPSRSWPMGVYDGHLLSLIQADYTAQGQTFTSGTLVALDLDDMTLSTVLVPARGESIEDVSIGKKAIAVQMLSDVVGELRILRRKGDGWRSLTAQLPDNGVVSIEAGSSSRNDWLVSFESLTMPNTLYHVDKKGRARALRSLPATFDAADVTVEQRFATSADGTQVPYFIMGRTDVLEAGPAPTIQYGYGGFLAAILPEYFSENARPQHGAIAGPLWVQRGGVLVLSNIRGGSEYGPEWHSAALKHDRQRAYDDFFAIAEDLVDSGVTTPSQLGAIGRSNGGLLMGVALTQRPDLYAAIDIGVPLLDMKRYHTLLAGASWMGEYGNPDVPEDWAVLSTYSPYQNVRGDVDYPAVLFYTSTLDDRVHPGHARKMAALLDEMGVDFEYMENIEGGHGGVANHEQSAHRLAMELGFMARELGLTPPVE